MALKLSWVETKSFWEIPVLYEDEHLLALNKPADLAVGPHKSDPNPANLIGLLHRGISEAKPWATARSLSFLMFSHRLDPEATGVLLLAKSKVVLIKLLDLFGSESPRLSFITLVGGTPAQDQFSVEAKLAPHPTKTGLVRVETRYGKRARTLFEVREKFGSWTLLKCVPLTHRSHQIRAHLMRTGLPVVGDEAYGGRALWLSRLKQNYHLKPGHTERPLLGRLCLHSEQLDLLHPVTGESLRISAPWPKDLLVAIKYLRKYSVV